MTTIAAATPADLPALLELLGQSALPTAGLADHVDTAFVARDAGSVVGSAALELYRSLDFVAVARRRNYYAQPAEDALVLRKEGLEAYANQS